MRDEVILLSDSESTKGTVVEPLSQSQYVSEQTSVLAASLTAPTTITRHALARLQPTEDKSVRRDRALTMLARLEKRLEQLLDLIDPTDLTFRHVKRALADADDDELGALGVSSEWAWLDDVVAALVTGAPFVSIETVGPYAAHHLTENGEFDVDPANLPADERTGLLLGAMFRDMVDGCANYQMCALLDDLSSDYPGRDFTTEESDQYVVGMAAILRRYGVIRPEDTAGKEFLLIREREQMALVDELIEGLSRCNAGNVEHTFEGDVIFHPTTAFIDKLALDSSNRIREFRRKGIAIKRAGRPTCQALDAATFLPRRNHLMLHLVILDRHFTSQQEKTYALVRALDIVAQDRHHNVLFDAEALSPEVITYAIGELLMRELRRYLQRLDRMDDWTQFDPDEYVTRNYGEALVSEDRQIIQFLTKELERSGLAEGSARLVADIGAGPNFYPAMLLAPYVHADGAIDLIEYGAANRAYAEATLLHQQDENNAGIWAKFEQLMVGTGGGKYVGAFERACSMANVVAGSIFSLPKNRYDIVTSYFVPDSITVSRREFWIAIRSLAACVKSDGLMVIAHMVGSNEYYAGTNTHFPSVNLTVDDIIEAYRDADLDFEVHAVGEDAPDKVRDGYHGMCVVVARRSDRFRSEF